jgi:hypothetical protein
MISNRKIGKPSIAGLGGRYEKEAGLGWIGSLGGNGVVSGWPSVGESQSVTLTGRTESGLLAKTPCGTP